MDTDVTAIRIAGVAAGSLYTGRIRLKGVVFCATGAGQLELRDGLSAAGPVKLTLDVVAGTGDIIIPSGGVLFANGIFATSSGLFVSANMFIG
jgi:hypothetical protein